MILIISSDQDESTFEILKWLRSVSCKYVLVTEYNRVEYITIDPAGRVLVQLCNQSFYLDEIICSWYRRGLIEYKEMETENWTELKDAILKFQNTERKKLIQYVQNKLYHKQHLSHFFSSRVNKLVVLDHSKEFGLKILKSIVTTFKKDVMEFHSSLSGNIINKVIGNPVKFYKDGYWLPTYTEKLCKSDIDNLPEMFSESFFQEQIIKRYELRSVFLLDRFYTMAIFSQNDPKTSVDFRKYNHETPNRTVPFELPTDITVKLRSLVAKLNLKFCSIDFMVTDDLQFYFLEVNPVGQFGMTSYPSNFYLEKRIADYLNNAHTHA